MSREVVFVDGARTAFGRMSGTIKDFPPSTLAGITIKGLVDKTNILERSAVDCVFAGSALHDCQSYNPARFALLAAGLPYEVSASYIEMQCGSAIDSINHAAWKIIAGAAEVVIAGGMESYSQAFAKFSMATPPYQLMPPTPIKVKLTPVEEDNLSMLEISDRLARLWQIDREACDEFAYTSQQRAAKAAAAGYFKEEIVPVVFPATKKTPETIFDRDEHLRPETSMADLGKLKPVLGNDGVTTAGNASGRNDGAAFVLMMSKEKAEALGYKPLARWVTGADVGVDPKVMGIAPAYSNLLALKRAGLNLGDVNVFECNEAFASQNLAVIKEMEKQTGKQIPREDWNPNGGAIAFGHPNGASGARITIFAMKELARRGARYALVSSCCGGGLGVTTLIENLQ